MCARAGARLCAHAGVRVCKRASGRVCVRACDGKRPQEEGLIKHIGISEICASWLRAAHAVQT